MPLVPFERVTLHTELRADEVYRRLAAAVGPGRWFTDPWPAHGKPYQGGVTPTEFKIARAINYRNSFLPMVIGRIRSNAVGSVVEVVLRPHLFVAAFMTTWLTATAVAAISTMWEALSNDQNRPAAVMALLPAGLFVFGYTLMQTAFLAESKKAKRFLEELTR